MLALDVARVEAGLLLIDVDFNSSKKALIEAQKYSPFEMGLGRLVQLDTRPFVGREALLDEQRRGPARQIVGPRGQLAGGRNAVRQRRVCRRSSRPRHRAWRCRSTRTASRWAGRRRRRGRRC